MLRSACRKYLVNAILHRLGTCQWRRSAMTVLLLCRLRFEQALWAVKLKDRKSFGKCTELGVCQVWLSSLGRVPVWVQFLAHH